MKRDGQLESLWQQANISENPHFSDGSDTYDVLIVGAGITGVSTALQLQKSGLQCIICEAQNPGFGTTGGTTAHLNNVLDSSYDRVQKDFGKENAQLLADAANEAMAQIRSNIKDHQIDCDYAERTAYLFSVEEAQDQVLEDMLKATNEVGISMSMINDSPFTIPYRKIASLPAQAQFHPLKYIDGLLKAFTALGGKILEQCRVEKVDEAQVLAVHTSQGKMMARHLFYATHIPPGVNLLHFRCAPYRSYAIALQLKDEKYPEALGYDLCDPYHYYRSHTIDGTTYLIAGGEDHKTGHEENAEQCFRKLEAYVRQYYDVDKIAFKWSSQYFEPADGLAYIGRLPGNPDNVYTATGFSGNGMIYGTLASMIIPDIIQARKNKYEKLFDPSRVKPVAGFSNFVKEAADVVGHFIGDRFKIDKIHELSSLSPGEGRLVKYEGHTLAVYKDENHRLYSLNAACSHIKCTVHWNNAEKTWDCPCHGSRFSYDGTVVTAPARKDLQVIEVDEG